MKAMMVLAALVLVVVAAVVTVMVCRNEGGGEKRREKEDEEHPAAETAMRKTMLGWATALARWRTRSINKRLAALEERVRYMLDAAVFTKQLVTRKVTLVDKKGQARVTLAVGDDGTSGLMFLGEDRRVRIIISVKDGRPGIYLYDADGKVRAAMSIYNDRATIKVSGTGLAESMLTACKDIVATIITDNVGKPRCILFGDEHALSTYSWLMLLGAEGERVFTAPPDGYPDRGDGRDWKKVFGF